MRMLAGSMKGVSEFLFYVKYHSNDDIILQYHQLDDIIITDQKQGGGGTAMKISAKKDFYRAFEEVEYVVDLSRGFEGYSRGDIIIRGCPFGPVELPLWLELAISEEGQIKFRNWKFDSSNINSYFHTSQHRVLDGHRAENDPQEPFPGWDAVRDGKDNRKPIDFNGIRATQAQINTVNGLFSGRIRWEGLKLAIGASVQKICPIDVKMEEVRTGEKIYLS